MMRISKMLAGLLGGLAVSITVPVADAVDSANNPEATDNPYQGITERNIFHLNPPPPPPDPEANKPPPPKIFLTGITTLGGSRRALLKATPPAKPGEPPKDKSYLLSEGERQDDLEVVAIDEQAATVKVSYAGVETTLNFKDNGVASATPAAPGPPGAPGAKPGQPVPPAPAPAFRAPTIPPRPVRGKDPVTPEPATAAANNGMGVTGGTPSTAAPPPMTAEQQAVLVEMNRELSKSDPTMPPFPPTVLTEGLNAAAEEEAAAAANARAGAAAPSSSGTPGPSLPIPGRPMLPF